ncbi:uncharacterized protein LOC117193383 isoform X2 [Drosophila miranda]|uniref:uncharacterized protein LOC117193383 isoform X2 n=1 Tax=Drosophila miranda TaxID=7229 RepID=UPI00143FA101|nr:uncharacterized protein LOC117193383 isoform X2 [Drosophila miranda]
MLRRCPAVPLLQARNTSCRSVDTNSRYRTPPSLTRRFTLLAVGFIRTRERVTTAGHSSRLTDRHRELSADLVWGHDAWRWSSGRRASARSPGHDACRPSLGRSPWPGSGHRQGPLSHGSGECCSAASSFFASAVALAPSSASPSVATSTSGAAAGPSAVSYVGVFVVPSVWTTAVPPGASSGTSSAVGATAGPVDSCGRARRLGSRSSLARGASSHSRASFASCPGCWGAGPEAHDMCSVCTCHIMPSRTAERTSCETNGPMPAPCGPCQCCCCCC